MMTSRERVRAALAHKEADRIPIDLGTTNSTGIAATAYTNLLDHLGYQNRQVKLANVMQQLALVDEDILDRLGIDTRPVSPNALAPLEIQQEPDGQRYTDEWGITWKMPRGGYYYDMVAHPLGAMETVQEIEAFNWPDPADPRRVAGLREQCLELGEKQQKAVLLRGLTTGMFELAAWMRGYEQLLVDFYMDPDIAHAILEKAMEMKMRYWETALAQCGDCVDVINESDDLGTQNGPLMSLDIYREFIGPRHKKLVSCIKKHTDAKVFLHSCGSIVAFIPDLIDEGFDILNPVQVSAAGMDPVMLKREFGRDITFWGGGIDTQQMLPHGTPDQIKAEVALRIEQLSKDGGYIFAPIHNIQRDVPPENIVAMYEAFAEHCRY